jgi:hypothetical protein
MWGFFLGKAGRGELSILAGRQSRKLFYGLLLCAFLGCNLPFLPTLPLTSAAARQTLDRWNPHYCKVVDFYGFYQPEAADQRQAFVLIANPKDPAAKPVIFIAQFQRLNRPDGSQEWFLTSLVSHSAGLTRRQGWDNLLVQVQNQTP